MRTLLVIEDDSAVQKALKRLFELEEFRVDAIVDGATAMNEFRRRRPDAVILDLNLPNRCGADICRDIKAESPSTPVLILSATSVVSAKVVLFEAGADDYITKPFSPRELLTRVRTALRIHDNLPRSTTSFADVVVNIPAMEVRKNGRIVPLSALEFGLLKFFLENPNRVISREELLSSVWHQRDETDTRTVDCHILKLRQKLETDASRPVHFVTLRGFGYRFRPDSANSEESLTARRSL